MGWRELNGWWAQMNRDLEPERVEAERWDGAETDRGWQELRAERDRKLGRPAAG